MERRKIWNQGGNAVIKGGDTSVRIRRIVADTGSKPTSRGKTEYVIEYWEEKEIC